jgi:hypothetical protein
VLELTFEAVTFPKRFGEVCMGMESDSTRRVNGRVPEDSLGQIGLIEANANGAFAVSRDILVSVWRRPPNFAEAERLCDSLQRVVNHTDAAGFWLITTPACEIPSVSVRRLLAASLRELRKLRAFAVSVEAVEAEGALMRAAIRSTAVAGGFRSAHVGSDVPSVATHLGTVFPVLPPQWGERVARILMHACDEIAVTELSRVHYVASPVRVIPDA